jgi:hypothetical protein
MDLTVMRAMTTKTTIAVAVFATIMWLSMILPSNLFAEDDGELSDDSSSDSGDSGDSGDNGDSSDEGTTEDDGEFIPDDATEKT